MKIAAYLVVFAVGFLCLFAAYVRLAPSDVARWHQPVQATEDQDMAQGAIRVRETDRAGFERADAAMRAMERTKVLAGSLQDGRVTYITRSRLWGFPDYTTMEYSDGTLKLFGRLRFGGSDLGVNAARLTDVLAAVKG